MSRRNINQSQLEPIQGGELVAAIDAATGSDSWRTGGGPQQGSTVDSAYSNLGAAPVIDLSTADVLKRTMNADITSLGFTNGEEGKVYRLQVKVDAIGGYSFTYDDTNVRTTNDVALIMPSEANAEHDYYIEVRDGKYKVTPEYDIA